MATDTDDNDNNNNNNNDNGNRNDKPASSAKEKGTLVRNNLEEALSHLESGRHDLALRALLTAWRARKVPALADVIDRVSALLTKGPIVAKTVAARTKVWLEVAGKGEPESLGSLLLTPWPGTWKHAKPLIDVIARHHADDPRLAMALAKIVDATPYDTWTSVQFYRPLFNCLDRIGDIRTLPILEAQKTRRKSGYWRASTQKLEIAAVDKLKRDYPDGPPTFTAEEEAVFAKIAEQFSHDIAAEQSKARGEADFLADIYKTPEDDAERQVFADWLSERGDPRGEFITIQLAKKAGRSNDAMDRRESSLLKKHGKEWLGRLERLTQKQTRKFEGGFLAEATLAIEGYSPVPSEEMHDPAWSTLHTLNLPWNVSYVPDLCQAILDLPAFAHLRVIRGLGENNLARLVAADVERPKIVELDVGFAESAPTDPTITAEHRQAFFNATRIFPSIERFSFVSRQEDVDEIICAPVLKNVKHLRFRQYDLPLGPFAAKVVRRINQLPRLEEIAVEQSCRYTLTRDPDNGERFSCLTTSIIPSCWELSRLLTSLAAFDANALTELRVPKEKDAPYTEQEIKQLETTLAKFPKLQKIDVPWERVKAEARPQDVAPMNLNIEWFGGTAQGGLEAKLFEEDRINDLLTRVKQEPIALQFDSYSVNGGKHMPLPASEEDVRELVAELTKKKRTRSINLYRKGASETSQLSITNRTWMIAFGWPNRKAASSEELKARVESVVRWLCDLLDAEGNEVIADGRLSFRVTEGGSAEGPRNFQAGPFRYGVLGEIGFLTIVGPDKARGLNMEALRKLSESKNDDLEWLRTVRSKSGKHLVLIAGESPFVPLSEDRKNALGIAAWNVVYEAVRERDGFVPHELIREVLGPVMRSKGFKEKKLPPLREAEGQIQYYSSVPPNARALDFQLPNPVANEGRAWWVRAQKRVNNPTADNFDENIQPTSTRWLPNNSARTKEETMSVLRQLCTQIENELTAWWSSPKD